MIPGVNAFFKCGQLDWTHWLLVFGLALLPVIAHENITLVLFIKDKVQAKKRNTKY